MSQVNFFMLHHDECDFFAYLRGRTDTALYLGRTFSTPSPEEIGVLPESGTRDLTIVHRELAPLYPPRLQETEGLYSFPLFRAAWIEWTRSVSVGGVLESGRIFAKIGWLSSEVDNVIYRKWYAALERWLKKFLRRLDSGWWIGPAAEAWSRMGGVLKFGSGPSFRQSLAGECFT